MAGVHANADVYKYQYCRSDSGRCARHVVEDAMKTVTCRKE
jgi:hypothetical protein